MTDPGTPVSNWAFILVMLSLASSVFREVISFLAMIL